MFINVEGILAKIAKMANEYWGNIPQIFSAIGAVASLVKASSDNNLKGIEPMNKNRTEG